MAKCQKKTKMILRQLYWAKWNKFRTYLLMSLFVCAILKYFYSDYMPEQLNNYITFEENYTCSSSLELAELFDKLERLNAEREVLNEASFGPVLGDTPVLAVRVARDAARLQYLVASLARVRNIRSAVVVFSHSFYDERVDRLINSITFCMVLQVYFPNSLQLFTNAFPGEEPDECGDATDGERRYCQQRDARLAEGKHHWWWMAHVVFEDVPWARIHTGMVVFLEQDNYVLPDLLHMLRHAEAALGAVPAARLLALGRPLAQGLDHDKLTVDYWRPPYRNGLTFNRTVWTEIKSVASHFCEYEDASWSYSLQQALEASGRGRPLMVACMAPRVISTGIFKNGKQAMANILGLTRSSLLFPAKVKAVMLFGPNGQIFQRFKTPKGNGGWWDLRDHLLCLDPLASTLTDEDYTVTPNQ